MKKKLLIALTVFCVASMTCCGSKAGTTTDNNMTKTATEKDDNSGKDSNSAGSDVKAETKKEPGLTITTENLTERIKQSDKNVLLKGKLEITINGTTFNYFDDYETVVKPQLVAAGFDMDEAEKKGGIPVINADGTEVNVLFQVSDFEGKKIIKEIGYALPDFMEDSKSSENIAQLNGYNVTEMGTFISAIGVTKENTVFVNNEHVTLRINAGANSFDIFYY